MSTEPGIYPSLPMTDYHADPALGHSGAVTLLDRSPAHFRYERAHPESRERRTEFDIGTAVHALVLTPESFSNEVFVLPPEFADFRKKEAQGLREWATLRDMTAILDSQYQDVSRMAAAVTEHEVAGPLLTDGVAECSYFWKDASFGVMRKCRPDYIKDNGTVKQGSANVVVNLKTATSAHPNVIARSAWDRHWWSSQAFTVDGLAANGVTTLDYLYVVVEKEPPHFVCVYRLPPRMIDMGRTFNDKAISTYAACRASDHWPAYPPGIVELEPPRWVETNFEDSRVRGDFKIVDFVA